MYYDTRSHVDRQNRFQWQAGYVQSPRSVSEKGHSN